MKKIAVLMTCHNRKDKTLVCLEKLFSQTDVENISLSVYLVDDGSTDGTREAVSRHYSEVNIISGNGSLYWNRGMRLAWEMALADEKFDYYLWLNDDTTLHHWALRSMLLADNEQSIVVGSTCSARDLTNITYGGRNEQGIIEPGETKKACSFFNGNIVLIPQFVVDKIGINDPAYPHALGDFDYGLRAAKCGIQIWLAPRTQGYCEPHEKFIPWIDPKVPLCKRLKNLYSPLANAQPRAFFYFNLKHFGWFKAFAQLANQHIRVMIPSLWLNSSSK